MLRARFFINVRSTPFLFLQANGFRRLAVVLLWISMFGLTECKPVEAAVLIQNVQVGVVNNFDLTTRNNAENTTVLDWAIWGQGTSTSLSPTTSMNGGSGISNLTDINPNLLNSLRGVGQFNIGTSFKWSDGTPTESAEGVYAGIQHEADSNPNINTGFRTEISGQAGTEYTADIWFGSHRGTTRITASLNGADSVYYDLVANEAINNKFGWATYTFTPNSSDDVLTVTAELISNTSPDFTGNTYFFGASLATDADAMVPEPASMSLMGGGLILLFAYRKRRRSGRFV